MEIMMSYKTKMIQWIHCIRNSFAQSIEQPKAEKMGHISMYIDIETD